MKKLVPLIFLVFLMTIPFSSHAFKWSANEFVATCSVIHQKEFTESELETVAYCLGVLKGTMSGLAVANSLKSLESGGAYNLPVCILKDGNSSYFNVLKDVLAAMRLDMKDKKAADQPNTANAAVTFTLIKLYPCLVEDIVK